MPLDRDTTFLYLGHSTILVETPGGKRLLIDPWTIHNPACPPQYKTVESLGRLDMILITHMHDDHAQDALAVSEGNPDAAVVAVFEAGNWLQTKGVKNFHSMNKGGTQTVDGIAVTMTVAHHTSSVQDEGKVISVGEAVGYVVKLENGFTFYAAGDTAVFGDMALLRDLYHPELALLPIGDHYTMGPREAALAIKLLGVTRVLPIHYASFPMLTGTPDALRQAASDIPNLEIYALKPGETLR